VSAKFQREAGKDITDNTGDYLFIGKVENIGVFKTITIEKFACCPSGQFCYGYSPEHFPCEMFSHFCIDLTVVSDDDFRKIFLYDENQFFICRADLPCYPKIQSFEQFCMHFLFKLNNSFSRTYDFLFSSDPSLGGFHHVQAEFAYADFVAELNFLSCSREHFVIGSSDRVHAQTLDKETARVLEYPRVPSGYERTLEGDCISVIPSDRYIVRGNADDFSLVGVLIKCPDFHLLPALLI